jgi:hypothetical protein
MDFTTPPPEGSTRNGDSHLDLIAACLPGGGGTTHWACGLPLSYVQEMADHWLTQNPHSVPGSEPLDPASNRNGNSSTGAE